MLLWRVTCHAAASLQYICRHVQELSQACDLRDQQLQWFISSGEDRALFAYNRNFGHSGRGHVCACRWASLMPLAVEKLRISIHVAAKHVRIRPRLIKRLRTTDLSNLWDARKGLLFWVVAICYSATAGQCFPLLTRTVFARFTPQMAMSDCCSEIAIKPLRRLKLFESSCCREQPAS